MMIKTYKYRLYPTEAQTKCLEKTFGLCRFLYNSALEERIAYYKKYNKGISCFDQYNYLPEIKALFPEYNNIHSQVLQSTLKRLDSSYQGFFRRVKRGEKSGFPRFKNKDRFHSIFYPQSGFGVKDTKSKWTHLNLSKIGHIPMLKHRNMEGNLKTCQIIKSSTGKYYACLTCKDVPKEHLAKTGKEIGIDLGIKNLIAMSNGNQIDNPKHFKKIHIKLTVAQQRLAKKSFKDSKRKASKLAVARQYEKVINQRKDFYHKISKSLIKDFDIIHVEKLNIKEMKSWRNLNREIQNAAWDQLVQMLFYKAESADKKVVQVDPKNTSKMCSSCGKLVEKTLSERIHKCECGLEIDRDHNAAINIYNRGRQSLLRESRNIPSEISRSHRL